MCERKTIERFLHGLVVEFELSRGAFVRWIEFVCEHPMDFRVRQQERPGTWTAGRPAACGRCASAGSSPRLSSREPGRDEIRIPP
ncbi:MAG: hypothetical protein MZV64_62790 [Ignavibacteriales bacterium]|nr:hypothetical protein [Ignavibacteriales bacterium]